MNNAIVRLCKMPSYRIRGYVIEDENGDFNIYINKDLTYEEQQRVFRHEYAHILRDHLHDERNIHEIEKEAYDRRLYKSKYKTG